MKAIALALVGWTGWTAATAIAADAEVTDYKTAKAGDVVSGKVRIGTKLVRMPEGAWELDVSQERPVAIDGDVRLGKMVVLYFHKEVGGRLARTLTIAANKESANVNWRDLPCKEKGDSFWIDDRSYGFNSQFCMRVGFVHRFVDGASGPDFERWARQVKERRLEYSHEMPFVLVTRYTRSDYLQIRMTFDPSISGIDSSPAPDRPANAWHPANVKTGSPHEQFYKALVDWAPALAAAVSRSFDGAPVDSIDYGKPALPARP